MASSTREGVRPPRDALVSWLARLYGHRLTTTTGGNLSMLDDDGTFYVTPSGGDKAFVPPSDVAVLRPGRSRGGSDGIDGVGADGDGNDATTAANFEGPRPPSIEWPLHAAVYRARPNYRAVLHAHSATLVAFSLARQRQQPETQVADTNCSRCSTSRRAADAAATTALATGDTTSDDSGVPETRCLLSAWQSCGRVVLAPYEIPGTNELADGCAAAFATGADCVILQNHGVVTAGVTMREAYDRFVSLEYLAQSIVHALALGPLRLLPERLLRASRPDAAAAAFEHISKRPRLLSPSSSVGRDRHGRCGIDFGSATVERCSTCCTRVLSGEEKESRAELCKFVSRAYSQNIVTASSGSFSLRVTGGQMKGGRDGVVDGVANPCPAHTSGGGCGDGAVAPSFLVTPTDVDRGSLAPADVCFVSTEMSSDDPRLDPAGGPGGCGSPSTNPPRSKGGNHGGASPSRSRSKLRWHPLHQRQLDFAPSRASAVHGAIYAAHPGVGCVMIVQPPHATAYCITGHAFNAAGIPEAYLVLRDVQILSIEDALLGDDNFSSVVKAIDPENGRHTILISGYGLLTVAADPLKAFVQVEVCEAMCGVVLTAMRRGPVKLLSGNEIDAIDRKFGIESAKKPSSAANRQSVECSEFETRLFINNQFVHSASRKTFDTINPATTEIICSVQEAQEVDVDRAVAAAKKAFQPGSPWRRASGSDRRNLLLRLADLIERDRDYLEQLESLDNGKPLGRGVCYGSAVDLHLVLQCYRYFAGWADKIMGNTIPVDGDMLCYTRKEPVGICGCIIPWNFPLLMMAWKLAPALACGNTVVLKTSEKTPLSALHIGKLAKEAGFPAGVVNVLSGFGTPAGEALARHMDVDKVAFTGSTRVGKLIEAYAAQSNLKNVSLECGGKSPLIVFDDADMDIALVAAHNGLFLNQGQCCCASSRIYVHEAIYDKFVEAAVNKAEKIEVGAFDSDSVEHGPQVDKIQFDHVLSYIKKGVAEGAKLASGGGPHPLYRKKGGYFLQPTVFKDVTDDMTIAKEEIFGPVMCILKFKTDDEVIKRANGTIYGLAAGIISNNGRRAISAAHQIRAGTVWINTYNAFDSAAPFGGLKQSGHGRDCGYESLSSWLETKTIMMPLNHNAK